MTGERALHHGQEHDSALPFDGWEGSKEGIAYSEFNHHLAGIFVLLIGFSELVPAFRIMLGIWARMLLPGALILLGLFLLIWSDHQAWRPWRLEFCANILGARF